MSDLEIHFKQSKNDSPVRKKSWLQVAKYNESYTLFFKQLIRTNGVVVKVSSSKFDYLGSIPDEC